MIRSGVTSSRGGQSRPSRALSPKGRRDRSSQRRSKTVGQIQRDSRRAQRRDSIRNARQAHSSLGRVVAIVIAVAVLLVAIWMVLANSSAFTITKVQVKGANHISSQQVSDLASVPENTSLLRVDSSGIESRLRSNPWVEHVSLRRIFPNTLEIDVTERTLQAVVEVPSSRDQTTKSWALASDGTWLMQIPDESTEDAKSVPEKVYSDATLALHITDVPYDVSPEPGAKVTDDSIRNALDIITGFTTSLKDDVASVSASSSSNAVLFLKNGVQIAFGTSEDIREKERVCQQLLQEHEGQISYINVRTVNRPTWRGLSS